MRSMQYSKLSPAVKVWQLASSCDGQVGLRELVHCRKCHTLSASSSLAPVSERV